MRDVGGGVNAVGELAVAEFDRMLTSACAAAAQHGLRVTIERDSVYAVGDAQKTTFVSAIVERVARL